MKNQPSVCKNRAKKKSIWKSWRLYLMCLPAVIYFLIFAYKPMYGIIIAFKDYSMRLGIMGSPWIGFENFERLFSSYWFPIILKNTLTLSILTLILGFPIPIILALVLNEVKNSRLRKGFQTISYAPHFISTVVLCGMLTLFLSPSSGVINKMITMLGGESINFLQEPEMFKWVYVLSGVWQGDGLGKHYLFGNAVGSGSSAFGGGRYRWSYKASENLVYQSPGAGPYDSDFADSESAVSLLSVGYEKVFLLQNATNLSASEVISTFV